MANARIIYVSPFAHYVGHYPYVTSVEPLMLAVNGVNVKILTFAGITTEPDIAVPQQTVINRNGAINNILSWFRRVTVGRWAVMFFEVWATLWKAMAIARREDRIIHLRDGDLYMPLHHVLALPFKGLRWCVSMTAGMLYPPKLGGQTNWRGNMALLLYWVGSRVLMGRHWQGVYRFSLRRNSYHYMTQNEVAQNKLEQYCGGVFKGKVDCVPLPVDITAKKIDKQEARQALGLPLDKIIALSFGSWHSGKDMETVFKSASTWGDKLHYLCVGK